MSRRATLATAVEFFCVFVSERWPAHDDVATVAATIAVAKAQSLRFIEVRLSFVIFKKAMPMRI